MPIVVVHGVNVRNTPDYQQHVRARDSMLRRFALNRLVNDPEQVMILNPLWGEMGAKLAWEGASVPTGSVQQFGSGGDIVQLLLAEGATTLPDNSNETLVTIAKASLSDAVDLAFTVALQRAAENQLADLSALADKAVNYAHHNPKPLWLDIVRSDTEFFIRLRNSVEAWQPPAEDTVPEVRVEAFGLQEAWEKVQEGVSRIGNAGGALGSGLVLSAARQPLTPVMARFLGDVFVYINLRGEQQNPGPIVTFLTQALDQAAQARTAADPHLIVIAHSMGGNITYDILSHYRPDLVCDVFVTVGSQVSLFEELKLFKTSRQSFPNDPRIDRVPRPTNIKRWLNVFDRNDVLSYAVEGIFEGAADFEYSTGNGILSAHTTYFLRPSFHERLGSRLRGLLS